MRITAGSTSVRAFEQPLRDAAALARTMLIGAAADRWNVEPEGCRDRRQLRDEPGPFLHVRRARGRSRGPLAARQAAAPPGDPGASDRQAPPPARRAGEGGWKLAVRRRRPAARHALCKRARCTARRKAPRLLARFRSAQWMGFATSQRAMAGSRLSPTHGGLRSADCRPRTRSSRASGAQPNFAARSKMPSRTEMIAGNSGAATMKGRSGDRAHLPRPISLRRASISDLSPSARRRGSSAVTLKSGHRRRPRALHAPPRLERQI